MAVKEMFCSHSIFKLLNFFFLYLIMSRPIVLDYVGLALNTICCCDLRPKRYWWIILLSYRYLYRYCENIVKYCDIVLCLYGSHLLYDTNFVLHLCTNLKQDMHPIHLFSPWHDGNFNRNSPWLHHVQTHTAQSEPDKPAVLHCWHNYWNSWYTLWNS